MHTLHTHASCCETKSSVSIPFHLHSDLEYDPESFVEQSLPLLVVGTKMDQVPPTKTAPTTNLQGAICINVDCSDTRQFAIGSPQTIQFNKFFDKVYT